MDYSTFLITVCQINGDNNEFNEWKLTPAYDLTFSEGPRGEHSTSVNGDGQK